MLLIPVIMEFSPSEALAFEENRALFEDAGFLVEPMGGRSYALKEYPDVFKAEEAEDIFLGLLEEVGAEKTAGRREKLLATMACKSAIKAGEPLPVGQDGIPRRGTLQDLPALSLSSRPAHRRQHRPLDHRPRPSAEGGRTESSR